MLALVVAVLATSSSAAQAEPGVTVSASCSSVTYSFTGFPNANNNTVSEKVFADRAAIAAATAHFDGPSGSNTVPIAIAPGHHNLDASVKWNTNGIRGGRDIPIRGGITCGAEPAFTFQKLQRIAGGNGQFTTSQLSGELGQTVQYEVIATNTGNVALTFSNFIDANCEAIAGGPSGPLAHGESATYTCEHLLRSVGSYENSATVTGTPPEGQGSAITQASNAVVATVAAEPAFTIEKLQMIFGGGESFTPSPRGGEVGQTVDYEVIVKDVGNTSLTFSNFSDEHCDEGTLEGGPSGPLARGESATYTCQHVLTMADQVAGSYENSATDTGAPPQGQGAPITHASNAVLVKVPAEPAFTIEKQQRIEGAGSFTTSPLSGKLGQRVDYEITLKDTGNTSLTFSNFTDANCEGIAGGPSGPLAPGESATYTCQRVLSAAGSYENTASATGTPPAGEGLPITHSSNTVVVQAVTPIATPPTTNTTSTTTAPAKPRGGVLTFQATKLPAPVFGHTANLIPISGVVLIKLPGSTSFIPISSATSIPLGTIIDATRGRVQLVTTHDATGNAIQRGIFYAGIFRVTQITVRQAGVVISPTLLVLVGPLPSGCRAGRKASVAAGRRSHSSTRKLWGDAHGNYRTVGRYAGAAVRGTKWLTEDSCAGTLIRVLRGVVSVNDLPHHRTVVLRAAHSFLSHPGRGG